MALVVLEDRILVLPEKAEEKKGAIYIPQSAKERPVMGQVVARGTGRYENGALIPMTVQVGDMVMYGKYSGTEIEVDGDELLVMRESDILGIKK